MDESENEESNLWDGFGENNVISQESNGSNNSQLSQGDDIIPADELLPESKLRNPPEGDEVYVIVTDRTPLSSIGWPFFI